MIASGEEELWEEYYILRRLNGLLLIFGMR